MRTRTTAKTLAERFDDLNPRIVRAVRLAHETFDKLGIRHVLVGDLAVGVYGRPRATKDVAFLVGAEAFDAAGSVISFKQGIPLSAEGVPVDSVPVPVALPIIDEAFAHAVDFDGVPIIAPHYSSR